MNLYGIETEKITKTIKALKEDDKFWFMLDVKKGIFKIYQNSKTNLVAETNQLETKLNQTYRPVCDLYYPGTGSKGTKIRLL